MIRGMKYNHEDKNLFVAGFESNTLIDIQNEFY